NTGNGIVDGDCRVDLGGCAIENVWLIFPTLDGVQGGCRETAVRRADDVEGVYRSLLSDSCAENNGAGDVILPGINGILGRFLLEELSAKTTPGILAGTSAVDFERTIDALGWNHCRSSRC